MMVSTTDADVTRRHGVRRKFGHGLPSLRPTMWSLVDDDDATVPVLTSYEADGDPTLKYVVEERTPRATIPEPAIKRAKARSKKAAVAPTVKRPRFKPSLASLPALVCDVCVAVLFVVFARAGTPVFARWLMVEHPAPVAQLAPPTAMEPAAATPPAIAPAFNVVEAAPAPAAPTKTPAATAKPKATAKHRKTR